MPELRRGRRPLTTVDAFAAGWADGANDAPLTASEIRRLTALHARYLRAKPA